jgi:hypothetical protein
MSCQMFPRRCGAPTAIGLQDDRLATRRGGGCVRSVKPRVAADAHVRRHVVLPTGPRPRLGGGSLPHGPSSPEVRSRGPDASTHRAG